MKKLRVRCLIAISFVGILSACGGEDTVSSEVVSPAEVGIAVPGAVAAVPSK